MERYLKYSEIKDYQEVRKAQSRNSDYDMGAVRAIEELLGSATYDPYAEILVALLSLRGKYMDEPQINKSIPIADALGILADVVSSIRAGSQLELMEALSAKI